MTFGLRIGGARTRVVLLPHDEYTQARRLRPFNAPQIVTNTHACPQVSGRVLQMPVRKEGGR
jgi:hypothetical protein